MSSERPIISFTAELERQAGYEEGREEDRQKALSGASEGDGRSLGGGEGPSSAGVSATANLQGVTAGFDRYLDRVVHFDRSGKLTVNHDVVRATAALGSDCFMRHLQGCCHLRSPLLGLGLIGPPGHAAGGSGAGFSLSACRAKAIQARLRPWWSKR